MGSRVCAFYWSKDDPETAELTEAVLSAESMVCECTDMGEEAIELAKLYDFDLILLDLILPDLDGHEVVRSLRASKIETPVLILSSLGEIDHKVRGLTNGADDYLTKPFDKGELLARIHAIVRRSQGHSDSVIKTGDLAVNLDSRTVEVAGQPVHLTGKEYAILELLSLRKGSTLSKEAFLNHLYGGIDEPELKIIDVFICKLRKKLSVASNISFIQTVWGRGYMLRESEAGAQVSESELTAASV